MTKKTTYNQKIKDKALNRMQAPQNDSIAIVSTEMNIPTATLYQWRSQEKKKGQFVAGNCSVQQYDGASKLNIINQCSGLNEAEISQFCREKGIYPEQVFLWREQILSSLGDNPISAKQHLSSIKQLQNENKKLERDLDRKNKALAESAALLVLSKKYRLLLEEEA